MAQNKIIETLSVYAFQPIINHIVQVYCFITALLYLITAILKTTNFIYADKILQLKPISLLAFAIFWYIRLWTYFSNWMIYINFTIAFVIGLYFYDGCCNIVESLTERGAKAKIVIPICSMLVIVLFALLSRIKYPGKQIFVVLMLILITINYIRKRNQYYTLTFIILSVIIVVLRAHTINSFAGFPYEAVIYLLIAIDAQGKQFLKIKSENIHNLFIGCFYFYIFVLMNERVFPVQWVMLGVAILGAILNR